jgi:hypothetical protein
MACWTLPVVARFPNVTRIAERSADWAGAKSGRKNLGDLKPCQFRFEFKTQLRAFLFRQPIGHLRKDGAIERDRRRLPRQFLRRAGFGKNFFEPTPHLVEVGTVGWRGLDVEQNGLFGVAAKVGSARSHSAANHVGVVGENLREWRTMCSLPSGGLWTMG